MNKIKITTVSEFKLFLSKDCRYDYIIINLSRLKESNILRYLIKHTFWKLNINGIIEFIDESSKGQLFSTKRIDFWQIRNLIFKLLKKDILLEEINDGNIKIRKRYENYINNGFSFGLIFSGNDKEITLLTNTIKSILDNKNINKYDYEILVCGPSSFNKDTLKQYFDLPQITYINFDSNESKRFMISAKKNFLYNQMKYNISILSHLRIYYSQSFMDNMFTKRFDFLAPKVLDSQNKSYLGFTLIGSYDLSKKNTFKPLTGEFLEDNFYYALKNRVPYIDGGILILNRNIIKDDPLDSNIAWGEGEDIDISANLYYQGYLIDYDSNLICMSSINKIQIKKWKNNSIIQLIRKILITNGLY
mgnify:CR=1 FL=1|jgi:hypothetical protein